MFGFSKEQSHRDDSFEYPQHMFWLRNKKNNFQLLTLIWGPDGTSRKRQITQTPQKIARKKLNRGSYIKAHVLLNLFNKLGKSDKMRGLPSIFSLFLNKFNKLNYTGA